MASKSASANYYKELFPFSSLGTMLSLNCPLARRELIAVVQPPGDGEKWSRYISVSSGMAMKKTFSGYASRSNLKSIHTGPVYDAKGPRRQVEGEEVSLRRELVIDIDVTDYAMLRLTKADRNGCDNAWSLVQLSVSILRTLLEDMYGFKKTLVFYSGGRGAHIWVMDKRAMDMGREEIDAVIWSLSIEHREGRRSRAYGMLGDVVDGVRHPDHPCFSASIDRCVDYFMTTGCAPKEEGGLGLLGTLSDVQEFVNLMKKKEGHFADLASQAIQCGGGREAAAYIQRVLYSIASTNEKCYFFKNMFKEAVMTYVWPRIDVNVTKDVKHCLKAPFSMHSSSRIAVFLSDPSSFHPSSCPTVSDLCAAEGRALFNGHVQDFESALFRMQVEIEEPVRRTTWTPNADVEEALPLPSRAIKKTRMSPSYTSLARRTYSIRPGVDAEGLHLYVEWSSIPEVRWQEAPEGHSCLKSNMELAASVFGKAEQIRERVEQAGKAKFLTEEVLLCFSSDLETAEEMRLAFLANAECVVGSLRFWDRNSETEKSRTALNLSKLRFGPSGTRDYFVVCV